MHDHTQPADEPEDAFLAWFDHVTRDEDASRELARGAAWHDLVDYTPDARRAATAARRALTVGVG